MPARKVAVIVGSLRREAFSRRVANALRLAQPPTINLEIAEIGGLALFNQDDERNPAKPAIDFRDRIRASDAVLFVTPEHNRSIPAALKNALDVGSRPYGENVWAGKPCAVISTSPGAIGGFGANHHLRQCLAALDMPAMPFPEMYLGGVDKLVDAEGHVTNDRTRDLRDKFMNAFGNWIERNLRAA